MPLYAIPISSSSQPKHVRTKYRSRIRNGKRKRGSATSPPSTESEQEDLHHVPSHILGSNPHNLGPDEIRQYRLAGLPLEETLPDVKHFPHRRLPVEKPAWTDRRNDGDAAAIGSTSGRSSRSTLDTEGQSLKIQHLAVLVAILHRCLASGDIARATRAFSMLLRTQTKGHPIDLRGSGYWGIGAELLMRSADEAGTDAASEVREANKDKPPRHRVAWDWGSASGLEKLKDYYGRLILQFPRTHMTARHGYLTALEFWPMLITCEIYGVQAEREAALQRLAMVNDAREHSGSEEEEDAEHEMGHFDGSSESEYMHADDVHLMRPRRTANAQNRAISQLQERETARRNALGAAEQIAAKMDTTMNEPPYSNDPAMLRLRGMLALYIGDLVVPELKKVLDIDIHDPQARFLRREQEAAQANGKATRHEHRLKARSLFDKLSAVGGKIDVDLDLDDESLAMDHGLEDDNHLGAEQNSHRLSSDLQARLLLDTS